MEKLDKYDGFWRDKVSQGSSEEKIKYLGHLIRNQTEQLKGSYKEDDKNFHKKIIQLAKMERKNLKE